MDLNNHIELEKLVLSAKIILNQLIQRLFWFCLDVYGVYAFLRLPYLEETALLNLFHASSSRTMVVLTVPIQFTVQTVYHLKI